MGKPESDELFFSPDPESDEIPIPSSNEDMQAWLNKVGRTVEKLKVENASVRTIVKGHERQIEEQSTSIRSIEQSVSNMDKALRGDGYGNKGIVDMHREAQQEVMQKISGIEKMMGSMDKKIAIGAVIVTILAAFGQSWLSGKF